MTKIISRECRFVFYLPANEVREDTHVVKEILHYDDGSSSKNLRVIHNFKRPYWVTRENKRQHNQKKESEELNNLTTGNCTDSTLARSIATKLGPRFNGVSDLWAIKKSPYVYGVDINSRTYVKHAYAKKYPSPTTPYEVCVLDIEVDTLTNEIIILSIATKEKMYTVITKKYLQNRITSKESISDISKEVIPKLKYLYSKHVPDTPLSKSINIEYAIAEDELDAIKLLMNKVHSWEPDFIAVWNIDYDMNKMLDVLRKYHVSPMDVFCSPDLPEELKYFKYVEGSKQKVTASGKFKPVEPKDKWNTVDCPASFYWIDAMCAYNYIRIGGKQVPGGYSLDNILRTVLGSDLGKLKFADEESDHIKGIDWHQYMVANKPLEYIIYNNWDVMSVLVLDDKTKDLQNVLPMLSGISNFDIFNSGPKRIVDALHFFYLDNDRVLSCKDPKVENKDLLGLGGWITLLPSYRISDNGVPLLEEGGNNSNIRKFVYDSD